MPKGDEAMQRRILRAIVIMLACLAAALYLPRALAQTAVESDIPEAGFPATSPAPGTAPQPSPSAPNSRSTTPNTAPTIQVYSRETILDVLVTDDKGQPVRGLTRSDFTVLEEGHPQPIRSFSEFDKATPLAPARTLLPGTYTNASALPPSGPVQVFYFDLPCATSYPAGSDFVADTNAGAIFVRAKKYIADYFRTMPTGTQVALFVYRCDYGLRLLQGFTADGPRAASAIDNLVVLSIGKPPSAATSDPIAAADKIAAYVAGIHGRKNLIWIGKPLDVMRDGGLSWSIAGPPDMVYVHRMMDLYDLFTREQIAVYPFNPVGLPVRGGLGWESLRVEDIATQTGGAAIYNTNDYKSAIAKIVDDTSHFYTLSYIPPRAFDDGHYHPIKITVDRPGLHLTYRNGYNDEHPAPPDAVLKVHMDQATMGLGALPATQLTFDLQVTPSAASNAPNPNPSSTRRALPTAGKARVTYNVLYKLDQSQIDFAASTDGLRNAWLEFDVAAYDPDGKLLALRSQTLKLPLTSQEYRQFIQQPFQFFLPIDLPPGQATLRAGVFDGISNHVGTIEIPLTIPIPKPAAKLAATAAPGARNDR
jgi:VWFA-related protein